MLEAISVLRLGPRRPRTKRERVRADKAYGSRANRANLRRRRGPNRLTRHRAVAARSDKLAVRYKATVTIAAINERL
ncbi:hypothetical protein [Streptomyces sp. NPDC055287]